MSCSALGLCLSGAAQADVTPADVWADWQSYARGFGYDMTSSANETGSGLTLSDLTMTVELPDGTTSKLTMGTIILEDNGDGTVAVVMPDSLPISMVSTPKTGPAFTMSLIYDMEAFSMIASGDPDNFLYSYTADRISITLDDIAVDGKDEELGSAVVTVNNVAGSATMEIGETRQSDQTMTAGPMFYSLDFMDPDEQGRATVQGEFSAVASDGKITMPIAANNTDPLALLAAGLAFDGTVTAKNGSATFSFTDEKGQVVQGTSSTGAYDLGIAMGKDSIVYRGGSSDTDVSLQGGGIPFPVELGIGETGFNLEMPLSEGADPQDFAFGLKLGDFTMSDMIWMLFDPTNALPRDPATIALDLTGTVVLEKSILDGPAMASLDDDEFPGELRSLDLRDLTLSVAGAELTGLGAVTFDNSDLESFDGIPAPVGKVDLSLTGGNTLLDTLVTMGLVPEDQAMGARMMMGLFAVVGEGPDTLNSTIEFTEDRQVLANGQRLK